MKNLYAILFFLWLLASFSVHAQDLRKDNLTMEKKQEIIEKKAAFELRQAKIEKEKKIQQIKSDKSKLNRAIASLKQKNNFLEAKNSNLRLDIENLMDIQEELKKELSQSEAVHNELSGFIRSSAKDIKTLLEQSLQSAFVRDRYLFLLPMINQEKFPSMDDIRKISDTLFKEIQLSGEVKITESVIVDRKGREQTAKVLILGNFTGIYMLEKAANKFDETGFLLYSDQSQRLFALSKLPSPAVANQIAAYLKGASPAVPMDISKGGALRQFTHELSLVDQVPKGGLLVWPILAILLLAFLILLERVFFFSLKTIKTEAFMIKVRELVAREQWDKCERLLLSRRTRLIPKILLTALPFRKHSREDMENALQEAILGEIPKIERFLSTLGMLAAIAPLMGLLGTVTGMINTFHVITYFGTSDPRMMSGGISEALVTTMLGLIVAIPIMLFHTLLSRRVETQIGWMEEKAVAFVNMIFKVRVEKKKRIDG